MSTLPMMMFLNVSLRRQSQILMVLGFLFFSAKLEFNLNYLYVFRHNLTSGRAHTAEISPIVSCRSQEKPRGGGRIQGPGIAQSKKRVTW